MLDVHPPHSTTHTWKDFFIHIATITVGLLIAISLEQAVELVHHRHQRQQLDEDLLEEAGRNRDIIQRDPWMQVQVDWYASAIAAAAKPAVDGVVTFSLPTAPCAPGYLGTAANRYFAPSEAVWTTAKESALTALIPAEQGRIDARLAHNDDLLAITRDRMAASCEHILSAQGRFATAPAATGQVTWNMSSAQAERFADTASDTQITLRAMLSRLRWTLSYEDAILHGASNVNQLMTAANQTQLEK